MLSGRIELGDRDQSAKRSQLGKACCLLDGRGHGHRLKRVSFRVLADDAVMGRMAGG